MQVDAESQNLLDELRAGRLPEGWSDVLADSRPDTLLTLLWLGRLSRVVEARHAALLRPFGLRYSDYATLTLLRLTGPTTVTTLQQRLVITSGGMTKTVDRLVKNGLAKRERAVDDGRQVLVSATNKGERLHARIIKADTGDLETRIKTITSADRSRLAATLRTLLDAIEVD